jgi:glycosyltransferase involved in cell wall biosynthesis
MYVMRCPKAKYAYCRKYANVELVIMGSTRHDEDVRLLDSLRDEVTKLGLQDHVRFVANAPYSELQRYMQQALIGLHTMWNEHFGISIVEMMAAGLIVVAHNSGGPRLDIVPDSEGNADLANGKADCCLMLYRTYRNPVASACSVLTHGTLCSRAVRQLNLGRC